MVFIYWLQTLNIKMFFKEKFNIYYMIVKLWIFIVKFLNTEKGPQPHQLGKTHY